MILIKYLHNKEDILFVIQIIYELCKYNILFEICDFIINFFLFSLLVLFLEINNISNI